MPRNWFQFKLEVHVIYRGHFPDVLRFLTTNISWYVKQNIAFNWKINWHCAAQTCHTGLKRCSRSNLLSQFLKQLVFLCKACAGDGCHPGSACVSCVWWECCEASGRRNRSATKRLVWRSFSILEKWKWNEGGKKKKDRSFCGCLRLAAVLHTQPSLPWQPHPPPLLTCSHTWSHADGKTHPHTFGVHHTVTSQQSAYTVWID